MPYRLFVDSTGTEWQVWDIVPRLSERRNPELRERRVERVAIPFADRRMDARRIAETRRASLRGTYAKGWLCFESATEKRRLSPIPDDWTTCDDDLLEAYGNEGERVPNSGRPLHFSDEGPLAEAG